MDPAVIVAVITSAAAILSSWFAFRVQEKARATSEATASNATQLEGVRVQMDGWVRLHDADLAENDRLKAALVEERAVSQTFAAKAERLEAEVRALLAEREGR